MKIQLHFRNHFTQGEGLGEVAMSRTDRTRLAQRVLIEALESRRLLSAGALDPSFSGDGKALLTSDLTATDVAVQADGKTVVVGNSTLQHTLPNGNTVIETKFAVARFNLDGT